MNTALFPSASLSGRSQARWLLLTILGMFIMGALSLFLLNTKSTLGVKLSQLNQTYQELTEELEEASMANAHATSLETLTNDPVFLGMVPVASEQVTYVQPVSLTAQSN